MTTGSIIESLKMGCNMNGIMVSDYLFRELFPEPKRATVEDMESILNERSCLSNHIHKGDFAHVFEKSSKEKLNEFCERNNIQHYEDMITRNHHFRFIYKS